MTIERRQFPRVRAPIFCRPTGMRLHRGGETQDIGLGGARVFADEAVRPGTPLELELLLPEGSIVCKAVVAWIEPLPAGAPARFDIGLRFTEVSDGDQARLASVLGDHA